MVARDADEAKQGRRTRKTVFPGKKGQVRVQFNPDGTVELEARRWGAERDGLRDAPATEGPTMMRREPEMLAPLEYGDAEAAALHLLGTWSPTPHGELKIMVKSVEQTSNGAESEPPVTTKEIHYACGKSLGRPLTVRRNDEGTSLRIELNEYLEKSILLLRLEDGLLDKEQGPLGLPALSAYKLPPSAAKPGGVLYNKGGK